MWPLLPVLKCCTGGITPASAFSPPCTKSLQAQGAHEQYYINSAEYRRCHGAHLQLIVIHVKHGDAPLPGACHLRRPKALLRVEGGHRHICALHTLRIVGRVPAAVPCGAAVHLIAFMVMQLSDMSLAERLLPSGCLQHEGCEEVQLHHNEEVCALHALSFG